LYFPLEHDDDSHQVDQPLDETRQDQYLPKLQKQPTEPYNASKIVTNKMVMNERMEEVINEKKEVTIEEKDAEEKNKLEKNEEEDMSKEKVEDEETLK
jgi:hypothetical protein